MSNLSISLKRKSPNPFTALRTAPRDEGTIYWDGGAKKIAAWKQQHLEASPSGKEHAIEGLCSENWICTALGLSTLEMEDFESESGSRSPLTTVEKAKIDYLLNV